MAPGFRTLGSKPSHQNGLTLIELVAVVVVIGILSGFAAVRYSARYEQSLVMQADRLRRNLAHAQVLAISQSQRLQFTASGSQYSVQQCSNVACSTTAALIDTSTGSAFAVTLDDGAVVSSPVSFLLDNLGRPATASGLIATAPAATLTLQLGGKTRSVRVAPLTGFAQTP
ncbi:MAG: Tfp pilus assembly protein FimT/FimU [Limnohabitans sp.]